MKLFLNNKSVHATFFRIANFIIEIVSYQNLLMQKLGKKKIMCIYTAMIHNHY